MPLLCLTFETNNIEMVLFIINDCSATPQKIQPYEALDFRHLWDILAGYCHVLCICTSDAYLSHQNGRNADGAISGNDCHSSKLRVQVIPQICRQPSCDRTVLRSRIKKKISLLSSLWACEDTWKDDWSGRLERKSQKKKPTPRGITGPLNVI
jgi:hypothetical protein